VRRILIALRQSQREAERRAFALRPWRLHEQERTGLQSCGDDLADCQLEHAARSTRSEQYAPRWNGRRKTEHTHLPAEKDDVDREAHAEGVNTVRRAQQQARSRRQRSLAHQAKQVLAERARDPHFVRDESAFGRPQRDGFHDRP